MERLRPSGVRGWLLLFTVMLAMSVPVVCSTALSAGFLIALDMPVLFVSYIHIAF